MLRPTQETHDDRTEDDGPLTTQVRTLEKVECVVESNHELSSCQARFFGPTSLRVVLAVGGGSNGNDLF